MPKFITHSKNPNTGNIEVYKIHIGGAKIRKSGLQDKDCDVEIIPAKDGHPGQIIIKAKE